MPNTDHRDGPDRSREDVEGSALARQVKAEIEALHRFFVEWIHGSVAADDDSFQRGFARRFDPGFVLIGPDGALVPLARLTKGIHAAHGSNPDFAIEIRDVVLRRDLGEHVVVTYEEWQRGARHAATPDNARISTALLRRDRVAPGGFAWLHLHECALPSGE